MILPDPGISIGITDSQVKDNKSNGGEGGIRTPDTLSGMPVFKTGAINHSATSPNAAGVAVAALPLALASLQHGNLVSGLRSGGDALP